jgi:glutathione synthase/RimK-type ligase-like ATP-grasp enzyme
MKIAIHKSDFIGSFSNRWIEYCTINKINYKIVNCYSNNIIQDIEDCDALMWHFSHAHHIDFQIAIKLIISVEKSGKKVFPNSNSCWHFDDKISQKYLLESIKAPLIKSHVFYNKNDSINWLNKTNFPIVFKLKSGSSSSNVSLINNINDALRITNIMFEKKGLRQFNRFNLLVDSIRKKDKLFNIVKNILKLFFKSKYEKLRSNEFGYVYFQDFIPNNTSDIRIIIIGNRAFGIKRLVRSGDFRASGSGKILYEKKFLNEDCVKIAFNISKLLKSNILTFDFIFNSFNQPLITEISYGFVQDGYDSCAGYWDDNIIWHEGSFKPQYWMVEDLIY